MPENTNSNEAIKDIVRGVIAVVIIIVCAVLVYNGKSDVNALIVIITGIANYFLGRVSTQPNNGGQS